MKELNKEMKVIRFIFCAVAALVVIIGLGFSYLIAQLDDAPGFVLIGTTITLAGASFLCGIGEILIQLKKNNIILSDIYKKINK